MANFFKKLVSGLTKTRNNIVSNLNSIFNGFSSIDDDFYEELEEILIMSDIGVNTTEEILDNLKEQVKENKIKEPIECKELLIKNIEEQMDLGENAYDFENEKSVILMIGVNGVGKTTSIGKLASQFKNNGKKVVLAAADTFRAAAADQLKEWANRANVDIVMGAEGSDPGSVLYDAISSAKNKNADILLCDTAGRLHNKKNLMEELKKLDRIIEKEYNGCRRENFIVLDATTGQNALAQARQFKECTDITGVILTKMDGSAKGGIAIAIQSEEVLIKNRDDLLENKINIQVDLNNYSVFTDSKWFQFILNQIINNSIKYKKAGVESIIKITASQTKDETTIEIFDNGIGIPRKDLKKVFNKSFTGENGRIGAKSTGMGLYIADRLCKKLGHRIEIESEQNVDGTSDSYTKVKIVFGRNDYLTLQNCNVK